ncbi:MAG TPA: hypothetical protein VL020_02445, partial [Pseudomonadales bacterium]|nr:hypothetical protein [Pseudomonadales bacterium]
LLQKMVWDDSDGHAHHGDPSHKIADCNAREIIQLAFLTVFVFWIGLHPTPMLDIMDTSVAHLIEQVNDGSILSDGANHGEHHALLQDAGAWIKSIVSF